MGFVQVENSELRANNLTFEGAKEDFSVVRIFAH